MTNNINNSDKEMAKQQLRELGVNPESRALMSPRHGHKGDAVMSNYINKVNELIKIVHPDLSS